MLGFLPLLAGHGDGYAHVLSQLDGVLADRDPDVVAPLAGGLLLPSRLLCTHHVWLLSWRIREKIRKNVLR